VVNVIGFVRDQIVGTKVAERHRWRVSAAALTPDRSAVIQAWKDVLVAVVPKIARAVRTDPQVAVRSTDSARLAGDELADYLESQGDELAAKFKRIRRFTETG
jgi:hypothetical protein